MAARVRNMRRVPLSDGVNSRRGVANIEEGATLGATVGRDLFLEDGTLVTASMILNAAASEPDEQFPWTYWVRLLDIPPNIVALAQLTGGGWAYMDSVGVWRVRRIGRQVRSFAFGDASGVVWTTPHELEVVFLRVIVDTPFNGAGAGLDIGTAGDPDLLLPASAILLSLAVPFDYSPGVRLASGVDVVATISPGAGASAGAGRIIIDTIPVEGI